MMGWSSGWRMRVAGALSAPDGVLFGESTLTPMADVSRRLDTPRADQILGEPWSHAESERRR
jgi:hypothetical protein